MIPQRFLLYNPWGLWICYLPWQRGFPDIEMGDILDYLGGTNLNLLSSQKWKREAEEWFRKMWCEDLTHHCSFENRRKGALRNVDSSRSLKRQRNRWYSRAFRKEFGPCHMLVLAYWDRGWVTEPQNCKMIHLLFKPLCCSNNKKILKRWLAFFQIKSSHLETIVFFFFCLYKFYFISHSNILNCLSIGHAHLVKLWICSLEHKVDCITLFL